MSRTHDTTPFPHRAQSLAPRQYGKKVTTPPTPLPVRAWIRTARGDDYEVDAVADRWTPRAAHIRFTDRFGRDDDAWVWAGAVTRRSDEPGRRPGGH